MLFLYRAGTIEEAHESSKWKPGDRVMALLSGGGYSECKYCLNFIFTLAKPSN